MCVCVGVVAVVIVTAGLAIVTHAQQMFAKSAET